MMQMQAQLAIVVEAQEEISKLEEKLRQHAPELLNPEFAANSAEPEDSSLDLEISGEAAKANEIDLEQIKEQENS